MDKFRKWITRYVLCVLFPAKYFTEIRASQIPTGGVQDDGQFKLLETVDLAGKWTGGLIWTMYQNSPYVVGEMVVPPIQLRFRMGRRTRNGGFGELGLVKLGMNHTFNCLVFIPFAHRGAAFFPASLSET